MNLLFILEPILSLVFLSCCLFVILQACDYLIMEITWKAFSYYAQEHVHMLLCSCAHAPPPNTSLECCLLQAQLSISSISRSGVCSLADGHYWCRLLKGRSQAGNHLSNATLRLCSAYTHTTGSLWEHTLTIDGGLQLITCTCGTYNCIGMWLYLIYIYITSLSDAQEEEPIHLCSTYLIQGTHSVCCSHPPEKSREIEFYSLS